MGSGRSYNCHDQRRTDISWTFLWYRSVFITPINIDKMKKCNGDMGVIRTLRRLSLVFLTSGSLLFPQFGVAQELGQRTGKIGEAELYTSVRFGVLTSDNAFRSEGNTLDSTGFRIAPSGSVVADRRGLRFTAGYSGEFARFDQAELDYNDHKIAGSVDAVLGTRKRAAASTSLTLRHEELGVGLTRGAANAGDEQVKAVDFAVDASYVYGAPTAKLNVTGGFSFGNVAFQNRPDLTEGRDYLKINPFGRVSYRLSSDTRALIEVGLSSFDFNNDSLDRSVVELLAGLAFQGSGKTLGQFKIGIASNNYSDSRVEDTSVLVANVGLTFSPSAISRVDVNFNRQINNEEGIDFSNGASQTISDKALIRWSRNWSGFAKTVAYASLDNQDRDCPSSGTQTAEAGLELSVLPRRWVEVGVGVSSRRVTADDCGATIDNDLEYDLNKILAFVRIFP